MCGRSERGGRWTTTACDRTARSRIRPRLSSPRTGQRRHRTPRPHTNYWRPSRELCEVRIAASAAQTDHAQAKSSGPNWSTFAGRVNVVRDSHSCWYNYRGQVKFMRLDFSRLEDLNSLTVLYYLSAFTVSVLFASIRYSNIARPHVFVIYLALTGLLLVYQIVCFRNQPKSLSDDIRDTLLSRILPLVLSIVTLDWIFQHTTPRGFRGLHIEDSDESQYVKMMLNGIFSSDTLPPYKFRWLTPLLTGSLNILPVKDLSGFTVLNFASLIMT